MDRSRRKAAVGDGATGRTLIARRILRGIWIAATVCITLVCAAIVITSAPADPALWPAKADERTTRLQLVSNGFHAGIVIARSDLEDAARRDGQQAVEGVATRFGAYRFLEFGWGEEAFYRATPTLGSIDPLLAARALFWPWTRSVVHVVGFDDPPERYFPDADRITIDVGADGFARLVAALDARFRRSTSGDVEDAGRGLYGPSLFYPATGHFSIVSNCNRWIGDLVAAAGLPSSPILALAPPLFFASLRNRMSRSVAHR